MAAALTIGENLKVTQPEKYRSQGGSLRASQSQTRSLGSLLKRSSSIQGPQIRATSTPRTSRASSNASTSRQAPASAHHPASPQRAPPRAAASPARISYSVDDSFNDSMLEQMGHEADAHYSNRAKLSDLKLQHTPAQPAPVKMVKKYIPTPNGIQVIEVPEATMKKEIARSNSLRSGLSLNRNSLRSVPRLPSLNGVPRLPSNGSLPLPVKRPPPRSHAQRHSSLLSELRIDENVEGELQSASEAALAEQRAEHELLKRQIAEEERLAKELEQQRLEYEHLKELRLKNERRMRELKELEEEEARSRTLSPVSELNPATLAGSYDIAPQVVGSFLPDTKQGATDEDDDEEDVPIEPLPFVVDELEKKEIEEVADATLADGTVAHKHDSKHDQDHSHDVPTSHLAPAVDHELHNKTLDDTLDAPSSEYSLEVPSFDASSRKISTEENKDEFGIEEVPNDDFDTPNLAKQLRPVFDPIDVQQIDSPTPSPRFDPVPEIIDNEGTGRLTPPPLNLAAASITSVGSLDSKSSRPIKSAMKMPKATYLTKSASSHSPAQQAYLSLTTAENTRLNSKLSSSQLTDVNGLVPVEQRPSPPKSPVTPQKRMSQSLRKPPSSTAPPSGSMAGRSLRPRSQSDVSQTPRTNGGGMSSRTFKTQPQPIPPHPALQPNYQSPSKLRAAELYAKANNRPRSQFQPAIKRKSSFTKDHDHGKPETAQARPASQQINHRTTLRTERPQSHVPPAYSTHASSNPSAVPAQTSNGGGFKAFKSRYADSDDEDSSYPIYTSANTGLNSRFKDSHDDLPGAGGQGFSKTAGRDEVMHTPIVSLRDNKSKNDAPKEEKPKKKKFLRKLFGKS